MKIVNTLKEQLFRNKKGITLIALVITVIVLLILAGVTVATLTGENGLLSKAKLAKERTAEAEQDEKNKLSSYEDEIDNYSTWERTGGTVTAVEDESLLDISTYSSTGLSIYDERIKDMQGGYRIVGNVVYVYIEATINKELTKTDAWLLISDMPLAKYQGNIPFQVSVCRADLTGGFIPCDASFVNATTTQLPGRIAIGTGSQDIPNNYHITIIGKYLKADETSEE